MDKGTDKPIPPAPQLCLRNPTLPTIGQPLPELYDQNITAKVLRASIDCLKDNISHTLLIPPAPRAA